jgi:tRNA-dihydrouridine synthase
MLAPMQGITNRALRDLFIERFRPDVVFTEFVRVQAGTRKKISAGDRLEVTGSSGGVPLVVQLIGCDTDALVAAADSVQELGVAFLNINLGCPYGRMTSNSAGGALLREPARLAKMLSSLRQCIHGSFSVKVRSGFDDSSQVVSLVKLFEDCGIDYLIVHPRTVQQRYSGMADHAVTAEVVKNTILPVIANGDVFTEADGRRVLKQTGAAGLMLGRGAVADPFLFERLRGAYPATSSQGKRRVELQGYLQELLLRYQEIFCGERQILSKMKEVLNQIIDPDFMKCFRQLKRCRDITCFTELLSNFSCD